MAPLDWEELPAEVHDKWKKWFNTDNPNMVDMISYPNQKMIIPRSYLKIEDDMKNFPLKDDDVWIVTYPKCGTTWMQETLSMLVNDVDEEYGKLPHMLRSPFLEVDMLMDGVDMTSVFNDIPEDMAEKMAAMAEGTIAYARNMSGRRVIKSHMSLDFLNVDLLEKTKVVYVARAPKDCAVSYFYHQRDMPGHGFIGNFSDHVEAFMEGIHLYGDYWAHLESAWKLRDHPNLKFVWYEDMKNNTRKVVTELSEFLSHPLSDQKMDELLHHISFDVMKKNPAANPTSMIKMPEGAEFLRKGKVGDWKNHFSGEELKKIDDWIESNLERTGIKLPQ